MRDTKMEVLRFWFEESEPAQWFQINPAFDAEITERFSCTHDMVSKDLCNDWARDADGALALCIVLDQFPRNMFRGTPKAFASDEKALLIAKESIQKGFDIILPPLKRRFMYLPFEHSEDIKEQEKSVKYFGTMKDTDPLGLEYAIRHHDVIKRFGRFPHRNKIFGRDSTDQEQKFLEQFPLGF